MTIPLVQKLIIKWIKSLSETEYLDIISTVFGFDLPDDAYASLKEDFLDKSFRYPNVYILDENHEEFGKLDGHLAAYDYQEQKVLVLKDLVEEAKNSNDMCCALLIALTEEVGHHIDNLLRKKYSTKGGNAPLDEGAVFAAQVLSTKGMISSSTLLGREIKSWQEINIDLSGINEAKSIWLSELSLTSDEKKGKISFFGERAILKLALRKLLKNPHKTISKHIELHFHRMPLKTPKAMTKKVAKYGRRINMNKRIHSVFRKPKEVKKLVEKALEDAIKLIGNKSIKANEKIS